MANVYGCSQFGSQQLKSSMLVLKLSPFFSAKNANSCWLVEKINCCLHLVHILPCITIGKKKRLFHHFLVYENRYRELAKVIFESIKQIYTSCTPRSCSCQFNVFWINHYLNFICLVARMKQAQPIKRKYIADQDVNAEDKIVKSKEVIISKS